MITAILTVFNHRHLIAAAAAVAVGFFAGWTVQGWRWDASKTDQIESAYQAWKEREIKSQQDSAALEATLAAYREKNRSLNRRLADELANAAYDCPIPADGLRLRADAICDGATCKHDAGVRSNTGTR